MIVLVLLIGIAATTYAEQECEDDVVGTVTKIVELKVTVKKDTGKEKTVEVRDLKGLKLGDYVIIYDNKVKKINPEKKKGLELK